MTDPATQLSTPPGGATAALAEVVCADRELLRAEFDAIIAANFPVGAGHRGRLPARRATAVTVGHPLPPGRPRSATRARSWARDDGAGRIRARQRAPPAGPAPPRHRRDRRPTRRRWSIDRSTKNRQIHEEKNTSTTGRGRPPRRSPRSPRYPGAGHRASPARARPRAVTAHRQVTRARRSHPSTRRTEGPAGDSLRRRALALRGARDRVRPAPSPPTPGCAPPTAT
jgi:hypothetical protein